MRFIHPGIVSWTYEPSLVVFSMIKPGVVRNSFWRLLRAEKSCTILVHLYLELHLQTSFTILAKEGKQS